MTGDSFQEMLRERCHAKARWRAATSPVPSSVRSFPVSDSNSELICAASQTRDLHFIAFHPAVLSPPFSVALGGCRRRAGPPAPRLPRAPGPRWLRAPLAWPRPRGAGGFAGPAALPGGGAAAPPAAPPGPALRAGAWARLRPAAGVAPGRRPRVCFVTRAGRRNNVAAVSAHGALCLAAYVPGK